MGFVDVGVDVLLLLAGLGGRGMGLAGVTFDGVRGEGFFESVEVLTNL